VQLTLPFLIKQNEQQWNLKDLKKILNTLWWLSFSALHNQYILTNISALCASINFFWFWTIPIICWTIHSKNQGSPIWCPGRLHGPSRLSTGVGAAKRHAHQMSSISCHFALWEVLSQTKYCCLLKVKIFGPDKIFRLATLLPAGLL